MSILLKYTAEISQQRSLTGHSIALICNIIFLSSGQHSSHSLRSTENVLWRCTQGLLSLIVCLGPMGAGQCVEGCIPRGYVIHWPYVGATADGCDVWGLQLYSFLLQEL